MASYYDTIYLGKPDDDDDNDAIDEMEIEELCDAIANWEASLSDLEVCPTKPGWRVKGERTLALMKRKLRAMEIQRCNLVD